jgi:hypothetical protein
VGGKERGWGKGGEMTQTLYAHMNKKKKNKALRSNPSTTTHKKDRIQKTMRNLSKTESTKSRGVQW